MVGTPSLYTGKGRGEEVSRRYGRCLLVLIALVFWGIIPAGAQSTPQPTPIAVSDDMVNAIARNLYCPVCQNTPLEVCPTEACARWREQVRELLAQGESETQIRQYFIDQFGMRTVGTPTDTSSQLFTIALPLLLIAIIGALISWSVLKRRSIERDRLIDANVPSENDLPDEYRAQLEKELEDRA